ncbi:DUF2272 domain-containing protein [Caldovatus sp. SYSU G05006]|uniref:DUF2272 domain-containing protein n=2 Tax=Caldovatus aquaticus TaxID=2865671 RepID=A0ABS7EYD5_9PROT|nr:DUF2272 domain-containing protein [Caldovatus aquaticus]
MLRIAVEEWIEWGRQRADPAAPREAAGTASGGAAEPGLESEPMHFPRLVAYWRAVPDDEGAVARNRALYRAALAASPGASAPPPGAGPARLWSEPPWSAAFISYVMRAAGVDRREFPPSAAHSAYMDALIADAEAFPALAPFAPHAPDAYAPQAGDLVCADRSAAPLHHWRDRIAERGRFRPMHCDIVVRAGLGAVEAIGGNVRDAVTLSRFPTDARGVLLPLPPGAPAWFAVFENRLGRLPPWGSDTPIAARAQPGRARVLPTGSPAS